MQVNAPTTSLSCTNCGAILPEQFLQGGVAAACPACLALLEVEVFPALFRQTSARVQAEAALIGSEAVCFYHAEKKAVVPCSHCGRFLCALCDVAFNDEHLCPACLLSSRTKRAADQWDTFRILFDNMALWLALGPLVLMLFLWPFTIATAPAAIFLALFTWKKPSSVVPRTKIRAILAVTIALLQIGGWVTLVYYFVSKIRHG